MGTKENIGGHWATQTTVREGDLPGQEHVNIPKHTCEADRTPANYVHMCVVVPLLAVVVVVAAVPLFLATVVVVANVLVANVAGVMVLVGVVAAKASIHVVWQC